MTTVLASGAIFVTWLSTTGTSGSMAKRICGRSVSPPSYST
jgi:hypothetical protein